MNKPVTLIIMNFKLILSFLLIMYGTMSPITDFESCFMTYYFELSCMIHLCMLLQPICFMTMNLLTCVE